ncbi:MAG: helix-turn-helix domain-containing protein, partial [Chloroflexota bacterium]|nr:helix-turn-helix domain-containing protein [Chloroflexota bacterium]
MSSNKTTADSIIVRFGDPILEEGHTAVPNLVLNYYSRLGITPAEMLFIIHVWQFWWTEKNPYPAITTIAKRMDMVKRQVQKYAKSLKEKEYIEDADIRLLRVNDRYLDGRGQVSSEYDFSGLLKAITLLHQGSPLTIKTPRKNKSVQGVNDRSRGEGANDYSPHRMNYSSPEEDT